MGTGKNISEAFSKALTDAQHNYGHGGYTGTLAEKDEYVIIHSDPLPDAVGHAMADRLIMEGDERVDDKWGPAGAIRLTESEDGEQRWLFFGWASS